MKKLAFIAVLATASVTLFAQSYTAKVANQEGIDNYPYNDGNSASFFSAEGISQDTYAQYEIGEWNLSSFGFPSHLNTITSISLNTTDAGFSWEQAGTFGIYYLSDNSTPLNNFVYSTSNTQGFGSDISGHLTLLDTFTYAPAAQGTVNHYTIPVSSSESSYLQLLLGSTTKVRLVIAAEDGNVATGFEGLGNSHGGAPTLTVNTQAVPEPMTLLVLAPAAIALLRKKSR